MHYWNCSEVEHVARGGIEASHSTLAQNDALVAFSEDVLSAQQQVVDRRRHSALQQHGLFHFADCLEERIILHVARADLDAICELGNHLRAFGVHRFGDDRQAGRLACARQELQAFFPEALEGIRRAARLERAAA